MDLYEAVEMVPTVHHVPLDLEWMDGWLRSDRKDVHSGHPLGRSGTEVDPTRETNVHPPSSSTGREDKGENNTKELVLQERL